MVAYDLVEVVGRVPITILFTRANERVEGRTSVVHLGIEGGRFADESIESISHAVEHRDQAESGKGAPTMKVQRPMITGDDVSEADNRAQIQRICRSGPQTQKLDRKTLKLARPWTNQGKKSEPPSFFSMYHPPR